MLSCRGMKSGIQIGNGSLPGMTNNTDSQCCHYIEEDCYAEKQVSGSHFYAYHGKRHGIRDGRLQCCTQHGRGAVLGPGSGPWLGAPTTPDPQEPLERLPARLTGKAARALAFRIVRPDDRPQLIVIVISSCICCIMCPIMSLAATFLFKEQIGVGTWVQTWAMNFPMALLYQIFYCGPLVRFLFCRIFPEKTVACTNNSN